MAACKMPKLCLLQTRRCLRVYRYLADWDSGVSALGRLSCHRHGKPSGRRNVARSLCRRSSVLQQSTGVPCLSRQRFAQPISAGGSIFFYRIYPNGIVRTPRGRPSPDGQSASARSAFPFHRLGAGYIAAAADSWLNDAHAGRHANLAARAAESASSGSFQARRSSDLMPAELSTERIVPDLGSDL
jgi:hypothetical protein